MQMTDENASLLKSQAKALNSETIVQPRSSKWYKTKTTLGNHNKVMSWRVPNHVAKRTALGAKNIDRAMHILSFLQKV